MYATASDYENGALKINLHPQQALDFNSIALKHEKEVLKDLLGLDLCALYIADLDSSNVPQTARFTAIYNEFQLDCCRSQGVPDMIKKFVYFRYISFYQIKNTQNGQTSTNSETQTKVGVIRMYDISIYNEAVKTYKCIREYILQNLEDYPEFKGIEKKYKTII